MRRFRKGVGFTTGMAAPRHRWLLVTLATGASATLRVHAWRRLRSLGALYLQSSVALLPERPETRRAVARLVDRVRREGGQARVLTITLVDDSDEETLIAEFSAERSDEYGELCSRTPAFLEEIAMERRRGRATYAEVEESEADLERLGKWLGRIQARDYFDAPGRADAEAAFDECARVLAEFEAEALAAELPPEGVTRKPAKQAPAAKRLRAVE